jgi:hypothetical protein
MFIISRTNINTYMIFVLFWFKVFQMLPNLNGGKHTMGGGHFGHFHDMYVIYIFTKQATLILGFTFGVWVWYFWL